MLVVNGESGNMVIILWEFGDVYLVCYDKVFLFVVVNSECKFLLIWIVENGFDVMDDFVVYVKLFIGEEMVILLMIDGW